MSETFTRIAAGHYRHSETGVEIVKVSADEAGQRGWHVTVPARGASFGTSAITATKRDAMEDAVGYIEAMRETIAADFDQATAAVHHIANYGAEVSCGATESVRITRLARMVTCHGCVAADEAGRLAEAERQAYAEDGERYAAGVIAGRVAAENVAARIVSDVLTDGRTLDQRKAAQIIAESRAPKYDMADAVPAPMTGIKIFGILAPEDPDDEVAWAAYCAAMPEPTGQQIADVLAEYGDPYAAVRAEAVAAFKDAARSIWKMRAANQTDTLSADMIRSLRKSMRSLRGCIEIFDQLTESWQQETRASAKRDSYTIRWDDGIVTTVPYTGRRS